MKRHLQWNIPHFGGKCVKSEENLMSTRCEDTMLVIQ